MTTNGKRRHPVIGEVEEDPPRRRPSARRGAGKTIQRPRPEDAPNTPAEPRYQPSPGEPGSFIGAAWDDDAGLPVWDEERQAPIPPAPDPPPTPVWGPDGSESPSVRDSLRQLGAALLRRLARRLDP